MGGSPPPPPPSCPTPGTVMDGGPTESLFRAVAIAGSKLYYNQGYAHSSGGSHTCGYDYDFNTLQGLSTNSGVDNAEYEAMISRFCAREVNLAKSIPGNKICAEHAAGIADSDPIL